MHVDTDIQYIINDQLRKTIRELREERHLNQNAIAQILGMSRSNYTKIEIGTIKEIKAIHLIRLCDFYGVNFETLRGLQQTELERCIGMVTKILQSNDTQLIDLLKGTIERFYNTLQSKDKSDISDPPELSGAVG